MVGAAEEVAGGGGGGQRRRDRYRWVMLGRGRAVVGRAVPPLVGVRAGRRRRHDVHGWPALRPRLPRFFPAASLVWRVLLAETWHASRTRATSVTYAGCGGGIPRAGPGSHIPPPHRRGPVAAGASSQGVAAAVGRGTRPRPPPAGDRPCGGRSRGWLDGWCRRRTPSVSADPARGSWCWSHLTRRRRWWRRPSLWCTEAVAAPAGQALSRHHRASTPPSTGRPLRAAAGCRLLLWHCCRGSRRPWS